MEKSKTNGSVFSFDKLVDLVNRYPSMSEDEKKSAKPILKMWNKTKKEVQEYVEIEKKMSEVTIEELASFEVDEEKNDPLPKNGEMRKKCVIGLLFLEKNLWAQAATALTDLIICHPNNAFLYASRGLALLQVGSYKGAEEDCTKAVEMKDTYLKAYLRRSLARMYQEKYIDACCDLLKTMDLVSEFKSKLSAVRKEYDKWVVLAIAEMQVKYDDENDINDQTIRLLGEAEKTMGKKLILELFFEEAIVKHTNAIRLMPSDPVLYANRAICWMELKNFKMAEIDCTKALSLDPKYLKVIVRRGRIRKVMGDLDGAVSDLSRAVHLNIDDDSIRRELAALKEKIDKVAEPDEDADVQRLLEVNRKAKEMKEKRQQQEETKQKQDRKTSKTKKRNKRKSIKKEKN